MSDILNMCQESSKNKFYFIYKYRKHTAMLTPYVMYSQIITEHRQILYQQSSSSS
jgi:hypothetical protein